MLDKFAELIPLREIWKELPILSLFNPSHSLFLILLVQGFKETELLAIPGIACLHLGALEWVHGSRHRCHGVLSVVHTASLIHLAPVYHHGVGVGVVRLPRGSRVYEPTH